MSPMYAVVSLLDEKHCRRVEELWADLKRSCGVHAVDATPFPHFSYHVAEGYDLAHLEPVLRRFARSRAPFRVSTSGLGIFSGPSPVVYVPVVRSPALAAMHRLLWPRIERTATCSQAYYRPDAWMPHITLAHGDVTESNLPQIIERLNGQELSWEIEISSLAVVSSSGAEQGFHLRVDLGG